jgi:hypothetical protein
MRSPLDELTAGGPPRIPEFSSDAWVLSEAVAVIMTDIVRRRYCPRQDRAWKIVCGALSLGKNGSRPDLPASRKESEGCPISDFRQQSCENAGKTRKQCGKTQP